jgi:hypothetical protein
MMGKSLSRRYVAANVISASAWKTASSKRNCSESLCMKVRGRGGCISPLSLRVIDRGEGRKEGSIHAARSTNERRWDLLQVNCVKTRDTQSS